MAIGLIMSLSFIAYKILRKRLQRMDHNEVNEMFEPNGIEMVELRVFEPEVPRSNPDARGFIEVDLHAVDQPLVNRNYQDSYHTLEEGQNTMRQDIRIVGAEVHSSI